MVLETELVTTEGVVKCILRRKDWCGLSIIEADMWRSEKMGTLQNTYTSFRASVFLQWDGNRYHIIQPSRNPYTNDYWRELETLLSNTIIINE